MIFYKFDARALTTVGATIVTRECALASCRFPIDSTTRKFSAAVRGHYEHGDNEHRVALNEHLSKKVLSYQ